MASKVGTFEYESEHKLRYWLFPHDSKGSLIIAKDQLEKLSSEFLAHIAIHTESYIWNYDPFSLHVKMDTSITDESSSLPPHLAGVMIIEDGIEDEWFVVYLLQQLTKSFKGLVCRIIDSDGEFLLIEAANFLPSWAEDPETAERRVYLKNGKVHLVPPSICSSNPPLIMDAVKKVHNNPASTLGSPNINKAIDVRTNGYPRKISDDQHLAHAYLPVGVSALLREYPTLVSASVRSFCRRDQIDNKVLRIMKHFPPEQRVMTAVRFPKVLYSQLCAHKYQPDRRTGWRLPAPHHPSYAMHLLGMKLACGFEILVSGAGGVSPTSPSGPTFESLIDVKDNKKWISYKKSLTEKGYFRGELEGSKLYQELDGNAQRYFTSNILTSNRGDNDEDELSIGAVVVKLLTKVNIDYEYFKKLEEKLPPADDEHWLTITKEDLDNTLNSRYGDVGHPKPASENEMIESLSTFMSHISEFDGAEIPPELQDRKLSTESNRMRKYSRKVSNSLDSRKVSSQSNTSDVSNMSSFSNKIDRNSEAFTDNTFKNILSLEVPEDKYFRDSDDDSSGMSSYEEDEKDISLSRKTSDGSQASSGVDTNIRSYMKQMDEELKSKVDDSIRLADLDDEFDDVEDFESIKVDIKSMRDLVKTFHEQAGNPGPVSTMFGAMGIKPME